MTAIESSSSPVCPTITVCTPTFNRAHCLGRVYQSLLSQKFRDFEWIVVDDGSTDDTAALVERWQHDVATFFPISYIYQTNQHKKAAFNRGVTAARGLFFICADSDDSFPASALGDFIEVWSSIPSDEKGDFEGVVGLVEDEKGKVIGSRFPEKLEPPCGFDSDLQEIRYRYRVKGDKWGMTRTEILRDIRFPEEIKGFVPESVVWSRIGARYRTRFFNRTVLRAHRATSRSGLSLTSSFDPRGIADGMLLQKEIVLTEEIRWFPYAPTHFLLEAARAVRFRLNSADGRGVRTYLRSKNRFGMFLLGLMAPVGIAWYLYDLIRLHRTVGNRRNN